jgi:hypothetical protein
VHCRVLPEAGGSVEADGWSRLCGGVFWRQSLSVSQQQQGNEDLYEYNNMLRHGIFEAYSGIFNGMSNEKCNQYLKPYVQVCVLEPPGAPAGAT